MSLFINFIPFDPYYTIFVFVALLSFIYSYYAIRQPVLFEELSEDDNNSNSVPVQDDEKQKYYRSGLTSKASEKLLKQLLEYMDKEKPYLDRDLTIHNLSDMTGIPKHHITQVLNETYQRNFFMFINEYRVKEVIRRMEDPANSNFTILAIAYDSGFNSKSTFNTIFKSITGKTPSDFIKALRLADSERP
ncbi:MAG: AraC family transcriptional regulator [Bacteroidales bacterium]